jgi:hypothetical protein
MPRITEPPQSGFKKIRNLIHAISSNEAIPLTCVKNRSRLKTLERSNLLTLCIVQERTNVDRKCERVDRNQDKKLSIEIGTSRVSGLCSNRGATYRLHTRPIKLNLNKVASSIAPSSIKGHPSP